MLDMWLLLLARSQVRKEKLLPVRVEVGAGPAVTSLPLSLQRSRAPLRSWPPDRAVGLQPAASVSAALLRGGCGRGGKLREGVSPQEALCFWPRRSDGDARAAGGWRWP